jgi:hypothetical protein
MSAFCDFERFADFFTPSQWRGAPERLDMEQTHNRRVHCTSH